MQDSEDFRRRVWPPYLRDSSVRGSLLRETVRCVLSPRSLARLFVPPLCLGFMLGIIGAFSDQFRPLIRDYSPSRC